MADSNFNISAKDLSRLAGGAGPAAKGLNDVRVALEKLRKQTPFIENWGAKHRAVLEQAMATQLKLAYQENETLVKQANVMNMLGQTANRAGGMTSNFGLALARLGPPTGEISNVLRKLNPDIDKAAKKSGELGLGMVGTYLGMTALDVIFAALKNTVIGTRDTFNSLSQSIGFNNTTVAESIATYTAARVSGILWGGTQKDISDGLKILSANFIVNKFAMDRLGSSSEVAGRELGKSVSLLIGMGHGLGATSEQVFNVASSLGLMGSQIKELPSAFAHFVDMSGETGLGFNRLAEALGNIAPVSQLAGNATEQLYGVLTSFKNNFTSKMADPIIQFANQSGRFNLIAESMMNFSRIAANMNLGEMMAFGPMSGRAAGRSPFEALRESLKAGPQASFVNFASEILKRSQSPDQGRFALTALATRYGLKPEAAATLAAQMADNMDRMRTATSKDMRDRALETQKALLKSATAQNALQDPLEKIIAMLESFFGYIHDVFYNWFHMGSFARLATVGKVATATGSGRR